MAVGDFLILVPQIMAVSGVIPEKIWSRDYPRELILYNKAKHLHTDMQVAQFECTLHWEMLADVDVELHTWVHAPSQFDCCNGFVLTVMDLVVIQDGETKIRLQLRRMSQRWFPKVEPTFAEIALFAESKLELLSRVVLAKPSPPLDAGIVLW
jgi:hypothetical protein